ncbi:Oxidoreductase, molybdopterin-binding domain-containing protein [Exophiala viscosa]|uniref:Oxidoreductase, molybdopterin-binding domain-containing protein n=1 Tax=Exophiala viscosa TaxID=2486360 RepID=UPI0021948E41|nr:Oxidoreductase, molybdopterin-binding domain-containing protein [Exophiala viscosa]
MQDDAMLAYELGRQPLSRDHGYPLEALVPGHTAARSVKSLEKVILAKDECQSAWQQREYKCFEPNQTPKVVDYASAPASSAAGSKCHHRCEKHTEIQRSGQSGDVTVRTRRRRRQSRRLCI